MRRVDDRYEHITDKQEVLRLLGEGEVLYTQYLRGYFYDPSREQVATFKYEHGPSSSNLATISINDLLDTGLYRKKPFIVRDELLKRQGEWVAAFKDRTFWWRIGFDPIYMKVLKTPCCSTSPLKFGEPDVHILTSIDELERAIHIADAPTPLCSHID